MHYVVCSDIHLGHRKTPTLHVANSFRKQILNKHNKEAEVLFIAGDLLDRLLEANSKEILIILELFDQILTYCFNNNIKLRVLEGTPSHDWNQPQLLEKLNNLRDVGKADLKYFKALDIEYMVDEGKYILYIPDEWVHCHDELERQIEVKLREHGISQVDIAILHGQFKFQFKDIPYTGFYFKSDYFLKLVKGFIHIGHYHTFAQMSRIIGNGSLERLAHRQEEAKGHVVVKGDSFTFIKNEDAYIYKTIPVNKKTTFVELDKKIGKYHKDAYIRIKMTRDHPFNMNFQEVKLRYLDYHMERLIKGDESETSLVTDIVSDEDLAVMDSFIIDTDIKETLKTLINTKYDLTAGEISKLDDYIKVFNDIKPVDNTE